MKPVKKEKHTPKHYLPDTTPKIAAAGATVLVLLVVLSFVLSSGWMHGSSTGIILPGSEGDSPTVGTGSALLTGQSVDDITIDVNNAKTVIATLARPAAYSSRIENTIYYDGGSAALYCHRYVRDNVMRTDTLGSDNQVQSTLIRVPDSKVYAWNAGDSTAYQGKAGDFTDDAAAMLPQDINGDPCIAVTFEQDGYRCVYAVSTVSGLLAQASFYDGDTLTRKVTVSELSTETPDSELFTLPDGESVI